MGQLQACIAGGWRAGRRAGLHSSGQCAPRHRRCRHPRHHANASYGPCSGCLRSTPQGNRITQGISCADVADVCLKALHNPEARNKTFEVRVVLFAERAGQWSAAWGKGGTCPLHSACNERLAHGGSRANVPARCMLRAVAAPALYPQHVGRFTQRLLPPNTACRCALSTSRRRASSSTNSSPTCPVRSASTGCCSAGGVLDVACSTCCRLCAPPCSIHLPPFRFCAQPKQ